MGGTAIQVESEIGKGSTFYFEVEFKSENKDADLFDQLFDAHQEKLKTEEPKIENKKDY